MNLIYDYKIYKIYEIPISHLIKIVETPDFQRFKDDKHSDEIYAYQKHQYKQHKKFKIHNIITLGKTPDSDKYLISDGQHRICAFSKLFEEFGDFSVICHIYDVKNDEELFDVYENINRNKKVTLYKTKNESEILRKVQSFLKENYKSYIKPTKRPHAPSINPDIFVENLRHSHIMSILQINIPDQLIDYITELNNYYKSLEHSEWVKLGFDKPKTDVDFCLGFFQNYEWIGRIITKYTMNISYEEMEHTVLKNTEKIPKTIRIKLWEQSFGKCLEGECYCCGNLVDYNSFEAGHVVSRFYGGTNKLDNLRVVCKNCNRDMGTQHMEEYKKFINN